MLSYSQVDREERSRDALSRLLAHQIDRNEELEAENLELEEEQRRLLSLLQIKIQTIEQLQRQHTKTSRANDSTMEMTHLTELSFREANETLAREHATLKARIEALEQTVCSKDEEMGRLRDYYTGVIDKLEAESEKRLSEVTAGSDATLRKLMEDARTAQNENQGLQQIILKSSEKIRELSQDLIVLEAANQELSESLTLANQRKSRILELERQIEAAKSEREEALLDQKFQFEQREMKRQKEADEKLSKLRKDTEDRIHQIKKAHENQLQQIENAKNQQQGSLLQMLQQSSAALREQKEVLLREQTLLKCRIEGLEATLVEKDEEIGRIRQYYTTTIDKLEAECEKKVLEATADSDRATRRLMEDTRAAQQENQSLQQIILKSSEKLRDLTQQLMAYETANEELAQARALANERRAKILQLQRQVEAAKSEKEDALLDIKFSFEQREMKRQKEADEKLAKVRKEAEERVAQLKKAQESKMQEMDRLIEDMKGQHELALTSSMDRWEAEKAEIRKKHQEDKLSSSAKIRELADTLAKTIEEKERGSKEQKRFKEELLKVEEKIKLKYIEFQKEMERIKTQNADLQEANQQLASERDNYRKVYESSSTELAKTRERLTKMEEKNERLAQQLGNYQQEAELLKQEIAEQELYEKDREQLDRVRQEMIDLKAKLAYTSEQLAKMKQENASLARESLDLNIERERLQDHMKKLEKKVPLLQKQVEDLKNELQVRCHKIETEMPYINTLIQEKTAIEAQLQRSRLENKRKDHLIEVAKRSKAEELIRLQQQAEQMRKSQTALERELEEQKIAIQQLNREKVNSVREATRKDDLIRELEAKVKQLKAEHRKSIETIKGQEEQIEQLYAMVQQFQNVTE